AAELSGNQRAAEAGPHVERGKLAGRERDRSRRLVRERAADVLDGAADGVLSVERSLRSAQDLDALHVVHVEQRALRTGDVDVVDVETDARIDAPERVG